MKLNKNLTLLDVFCIASGAMISSGIFILPGLAFAQAGPAVFISYFLAGCLAMVGIFSVIELSTAMPKAGGDYYFITRSMGPLMGTVSGFLSWFALSLKSAFAIFGLSEVICILSGLSNYTVAGVSALILIALGITLFFTLLNIFGVNEAAIFEVVLVVGLFALMVLYISIGFDKVKVSSFEPFISDGKGINAIFSTAGFVFISFGGLLNVTSISEEVKNPNRNLPLGMVSSLVVITVLYSLMLIVTVGILPADQLKGSLTPVADAARIFIGTPGYIAITVAAFLAFITTANAGIMAASRYPMALGRDNLAPKALTSVSPKFKTPVFSVLMTGFLIGLSLLLKLEILVKAASTVILTSYFLSNLSVIILRESKIQNYRPAFKTPFYPWMQIVGIVLFSLLIIEMGTQAIETSLGLIALSLLVYLFYGRKSSDEYALLHLIERITDKKLTDHNLENELKEIIHERDEIHKDEFDVVIEEAGALDIESDGPMDFRELFKTISEHYSKDMGLTDEEMFQLLEEREKDSSTAIAPFVAIPHIILNGENTFKIIIARCGKGVKFTEEHDSVKAIFFIIGSRDKRNLHLRSLAAIAQIVQNPSFESRWTEAKGDENLRDILLLGKRKRTAN